MEPFLRINFGALESGKRPGMAEIVDTIRRQILELKGVPSSVEGLRLPPIRVLAHQLGVSKNTVAAAYEELKAKLLIESRGRTGLYVVPQTETPAVLPRFQASAPALRAAPEADGIERGAVVRAGRSQPLKNLSSIFVDPKLMPKDKMAACFRSVLKVPGLADFPDLQGFLPLRRLIAQRLQKRGIEARPEHIVTAIGSQQALDLVCRTLVRKTVATENPAYFTGKALLEANGVLPVGLPVDPFRGIDLEAWERILAEARPSLVYLTPNFQNPTGYSYSTQEMARILEWSVKYGFGLLEDDWGSDMLSYSEFKPSLRALGGSNVLYMNSFTKKLLPSLRLGYVLGNEATIGSLVFSKRVSISSVPTVVEAALFEFMDRGYYDAHLRHLQTQLDARYEHCLDVLETLMPKEVKWTSPGGGSTLWLECPLRVSHPRLVADVATRGYLIQPTDEAFFGEPHLHGFKLGYAFLPPKDLEAGLAVLADCIRRQL